MTPACPVCGKPPKRHKIKTGLILSCIGDRHAVYLDGDGNHAISLHRAATFEALEEAWPRFFPEKVPA